MKTKKIIWMLIVILMATTTAFSQGYRYDNRPGRGYGYGMGYCIENDSLLGYGRGYGYGSQALLNNMNLIPGLTEDQKSKITEMEINHRKTMAELRVKQVTTDNFSERIKIREEMLKKGLAHRDEIRNQLNDEQKEHFDLLGGRNIYGCMGYGSGCRFGCGRGNFAGRGGRGRGAGFKAAPGRYGYGQRW